MHQRFQALLDARAPGCCILEFGCAGYAGFMAGRALRLEDFRATAQGAVGITNFHRTHFLQTHGLGHFGIGRTCARGVGRSHELDQTDDDEDGNHKREEDGKQQLLGFFNGACMGFFVVLLAHEVL